MGGLADGRTDSKAMRSAKVQPWRGVNCGASQLDIFLAFLDASTHLYMRVCPSVRGRSVDNAFFLIAEFEWKQHRIIGKVETWIPDCK